MTSAIRVGAFALQEPVGLFIAGRLGRAVDLETQGGVAQLGADVERAG